jgi:hypothetical protein
MVVLEIMIQKRYKAYANEIVDGIMANDADAPKRDSAARSNRS